MRCVGAFGRYTDVEGVQGYLGRAEREKAFGGTGRRYDEVIKTDFQEIEWNR